MKAIFWPLHIKNTKHFDMLLELVNQLKKFCKYSKNILMLA